MAFVILRQEYIQKWAGNHADFEVELKRHARSLLPGFACPEWVQVVDELPVGAPPRCILGTLTHRITEDLHWQDPEN
jgi:hypothetical protein